MTTLSKEYHLGRCIASVDALINDTCFVYVVYDVKDIELQLILCR